MTKLSLFAIAPLATLLAATAANAQHYAGHCAQCQTAYARPYADEFSATYHENAIWPSQYVWPSRRAICQAFELTAANGWRRNNLLGKYDFDAEHGGLSDAGRIRIERILAYAPPQRRTIFVQRGVDPAQTTERVEAVQAFAANLNTGVGPIDVRESSMQDDGRPAVSVDAVFTGFGANQPPPVLPASTSTGSGDTGAQ